LRILLLTHYFAPDITTNCDIMTGLAEQWAAWGHAVTVVTSFPHYAAGRVPSEYRGRLIERERRGRLRIFRTYVYVPRRRGNLLERLWSYLTFNALSTLAALFAGGYDVILAPSPPLTIGLSACLLSRLRGVPYVYNVHDIYPDIALRLGVIQPGGWQASWFRRLERFVYANAAAISVLSEGFRDNLLAKGVPREKLRVIPNFAEADRVRPLPRQNAFARRLGLADRFVAMYAGNLGNSQPIEVLLEAARLLADDDGIRILIVGNPQRIEQLRAEAAAPALGNVVLLPFQPVEAVPEMYASADAGLVLLRAAIGVESVPSKTYTIMASGRPVVASVAEASDTAALVRQAECGLWALPESAAALAAAIRRLKADPAMCQRLGRNGRQAVEAQFTRQAVARQYVELFGSLLAPSGASRLAAPVSGP
jgi:colanic acid biosynthesis glycosyl transferase WcaI